MDTGARNRKHGRSTIFGEKKNAFRLDLNESMQRGFLSERKGKVIPC